LISITYDYCLVAKDELIFMLRIGYKKILDNSVDVSTLFSGLYIFSHVYEQKKAPPFANKGTRNHYRTPEKIVN